MMNGNRWPNSGLVQSVGLAARGVLRPPRLQHPSAAQAHVGQASHSTSTAGEALPGAGN